MHRLLILPIMASLLTLTACTPGTYVPSTGKFYPTSSSEATQPWQKPKVRDLPSKASDAKSTAPAKPEKKNPGRFMM